MVNSSEIPLERAHFFNRFPELFNLILVYSFPESKRNFKKEKANLRFFPESSPFSINLYKALLPQELKALPAAKAFLLPSASTAHLVPLGLGNLPQTLSHSSRCGLIPCLEIHCCQGGLVPTEHVFRTQSAFISGQPVWTSLTKLVTFLPQKNALPLRQSS